MAHISTAGKLLIATPAIGDGNFEQSVIFMLHHDLNGALGVIVNDPTQLAVADLLPRWGDLTVEPAVVFTGGPVQPDGFIGVGRSIATGSHTKDDEETVRGVPNTELITIDLESDPVLARAEIDRLRLFRGYSGWAPHQLDTELAAGAWFIVESEPDDMWSSDPATLYELVLLRQQGDLRWFANAPTDPSQN